MEREVLFGEADGGLRQIDAGHARTTASKAQQVSADAAAHFEQALAPERREIDQLWQVAQLVEPILVEIVEKRFRSDRLVGHLQFVNALSPVALNLVDHNPLS